MKKRKEGLDKINGFVVHSLTLAANKTQQSIVIFENKGKGKKIKPKSKIFGKENKRKTKNIRRDLYEVSCIFYTVFSF
ncbi:MAG: hypothetical protein ACTTI6_08630 [Treponema sp.]|uniref:hypothetical protein n=1 Tax=Treponema sp. TaxID=166 RepID=UPI003FA204C1